jgi:hypothetical protein
MPEIGLPPRTFLYTVDQLSVMLQLDSAHIHRSYIFHEGRDVGTKTFDQMTARNIAPHNERPDWRVTEKEFISWMRRKGFKYYDRGYLKS